MEGLSSSMTPIEHIARVNAIKRFVHEWLEQFTDEERTALFPQLANLGSELDKIGMYFYQKETAS